SNSLMDNFIMDVQGSGYIDFGDGSPLNFFSYAGKNGWPYRSIFGINMVALHHGQPKIMNLKDIISAFVRHRREVVTRRTIFELR
ncbi:MltA domain-containing protein, partial [Salmonella enterica subsp. enterica serovar Anatum]|nr:MltA domain-containing protein [Salmonella enterica subsp. enterica serovar Anatum]